ncbi:MAG: hypothetical protein GKR89_22320 [Candidatus Latescibacteria bacterium]|nr:hypothetical protein [Candidatus Latescibacterota bacterium]
MADKTKRRTSLPNGRCKRHGGESVAIGEIHGIYAAGWPATEKKTLAHELLFAKDQLSRIQKKLQKLRKLEDDLRERDEDPFWN